MGEQPDPFCYLRTLSDEHLTDVERVYLLYVQGVEAERDRLREACDNQARLLFWAEALMRSMSGWPATHPNEFTDWKEDWRIAREQYKALAGGRNDEIN